MNCVFRRLSIADLELFLFLHGGQPPLDHEWQASIDAYQACEEEHGDISRVRILVVTDGGAPSSRQRGKLNDFLKGRILPISVISDSALVRGVVTAFSWFNPKIRSFPPRLAWQACEHVNVPQRHYVRVFAEFVEMQKQSGTNSALQAALLHLEEARAGVRP
jgi:hypothetical protein